jgi:hypothetical protein
VVASRTAATLVLWRVVHPCLRILIRSPTIPPNFALGGWMTIFRAGDFQLGLLLAVALLASIGPAAGQTYTPEQEQACTGDAFRLCSAEIPDVGRQKVPALAGLPGALQAGSRAEPGRRQAGRPADGDPAHNATQGRECQAAQRQKAGETRDLAARAT